MWDLPFVFGYPLIAQASDELQIDTGNLSIPAFFYSPSDRQWSDYIITLWTNFAKTGYYSASDISEIPLLLNIASTNSFHDVDKSQRNFYDLTEIRHQLKLLLLPPLSL